MGVSDWAGRWVASCPAAAAAAAGDAEFLRTALPLPSFTVGTALYSESEYEPCSTDSKARGAATTGAGMRATTRARMTTLTSVVSVEREAMTVFVFAFLWKEDGGWGMNGVGLVSVFVWRAGSGGV